MGVEAGNPGNPGNSQDSHLPETRQTPPTSSIVAPMKTHAYAITVEEENLDSALDPIFLTQDDMDHLIVRGKEHAQREESAPHTVPIGWVHSLRGEGVTHNNEALSDEDASLYISAAIADALRVALQTHESRRIEGQP